MNTFWIIYLLCCIVGIMYLLRRDKNDNANDEAVGENQHEPFTREENELEYTLDVVNSWVNNCDQKAGILLTVFGVAVTVLVTSDFVKELRGYLVHPFIEYWNGDSQYVFSWGRFTVFCLLVIAVGMLVTSCVYLFKAITANTNYKEIRQNNPQMVEKSYLFFGSINSMTYDRFRSPSVDFKEDLMSQIYANSKIAVDKFQNYNKGLFWFKMILVVSVMLFIAVIFVE